MFDVLPVECVCEMLTHSLSKKPTSSNAQKREQDFQKCRNLATRLSDSVTLDSSESGNVSKIVEFFGDRLGAKSCAERETARTALEIFFDPRRIDAALSALWGLENPAVVEESESAGRPNILPKTKHGVSIEHLLRTRANSWDPFRNFDKPAAKVSYVDKFQWLLRDVAQFMPSSVGLITSLKINLSLDRDSISIAGVFIFFTDISHYVSVYCTVSVDLQKF